MDFGVLGRLEVRTARGRLELTRPRQQRVLAALLLAPNSVVPLAKLVEVGWGDEPPSTAVKQVRNCVSALRERLGDVDRQVITTEDPGYRIRVRPDQLDSLRFAKGVADARHCVGEGALDRGVEHVRAALGLWRGPAIDGLDSPTLARSAMRLAEQRLTALELYADWLAELGEHREVVDELAEAVHEHPLRERLHAQLMDALDRCGRRADAMIVFGRLRNRLAEELGVDPGADVSRLHQRILRGEARPHRDGGLRRHRRSPAGAAEDLGSGGLDRRSTRHRQIPVTSLPGTAAPPVPRQLPQSIRDFTGRADHLAALDALLPPESGQHGGHAVVISALDGSGGVGKTTLAMHWAHHVQHRFPDGTLHTNLRGYGPGRPASPDEALDDFLVALGVPAAAVPAGLGARSGLFRTLLAGRRVLIVLDNANSAEQVRPLLPGTPGCMVLVTSRDNLTGLVVTDAAHRLTLDVLSPPEALSLVVGIIGPARADAETVAVDELIRLCAGLPLALRIAAGRVAAHQHLSVADIVAELVDEDSRLDALTWGQDPRAAVRKVLAWSYEQLPRPEGFLFRRLGLHPGPDLSPPAAAALAHLPPHRARLLLDALADAHLIEPVAKGRYRFHDLLRAYAAELARHHDSAADRRRATHALLTWYNHTAHVADKQLYPTSTRLVTDLLEPDHPHPVVDRDHAWTWFTDERANLVAALRHAVDRCMDRQAVELVDAFGFLILMGGWEERIQTSDVGLIAARRVGDRAHEANVLLARGEALGHLHRPDAEADLARAVTVAQEVGNTHIRIAALNELGQLLRRQGRHTEALGHLVDALALSRGFDTGRWEAVVEGMIAAVHVDLGAHRQAIDHAERSARLRRRIGDPDGEACALAVLAGAWQGVNDHDTAIGHCRRAIALGRRSLGSQDETLAPPLAILATSLHRLGHVEEAVACWREAATIYADRGLHADAASIHDRIRAARSATAVTR
ncbi:AfsR/SARP family transcriptional regulator [Saccharothrix texasensis]|uniref:DNA-binding SARP family transcriptional activator n=1 Tax=Saccharothrix texasensis TaxID=103734 RepID=A0A3N1HJ07_9PSEU|nr:BTAD domain-containing putative transcriptional regulator [Saccharothrix texasensis]ROP42446.1 DNA-binding SARP family transcriptional activator [Saccharothrix texasensis]